MPIELVPSRTPRGFALVLRSAGRDVVRLTAPVSVRNTGGEVVSGGYDSVEPDGDLLTCRFEARMSDGTRFAVQDLWSPAAEGDSFTIDRAMVIEEGGSTAGVRAELVAEAALQDE